ncbi:MAG: hypothetical protein IPK26_17045 [Planctomycetes bacterium]|nr:hypothetical protein [Planctomycetota bacterium]
MKAAVPWSLLVVLGVACRQEPAAGKPQDDHPPAISNRIDVPESVRQNLGIEFATVERRRVAATLRLPGAFELLPSARREYRTPVAGRVTIAATPLAPVAAGDLLYRIDSPTWRELQQQLGEIATEVQVTDLRIAATRKRLRAHEVHEQSLAEATAVAGRRVESLRALREGVGGQADELAVAEMAVATARATQAEAGEKEAETAAVLAELEATALALRDRTQRAFATAATLTGMTVDQLTTTVAWQGQQVPAWRTLDELQVRAAAAGVADVPPLGAGAWVGIGDLVLAIVDGSRVRFLARALQSDRARLAGREAAVVVPPGRDAGDPVRGRLYAGLDADPGQRTFALFLVPEATAPWCRAGFGGFLEVETDVGGAAELAVPRAAVLTDGLQRVLFLRDPADADKVIRLEGDLGVDDGRWVEVKSGLADGDQVVVAGAYELMLASSGSAPKGGHFHADGTWHADDEHK